MSYRIKFTLNNEATVHTTVFSGSTKWDATKLFYAAYWEASPVIVSVVKIQQS